MSRDSVRRVDYLGHIIEAIDRINRYCQDLDEPSFPSNEMVQDAVVRNFEIIGEASKNVERVAPDFISTHQQLPFAFAYEMRNVLAHGYYKVDLGVVWKTIEKDLPYLREQIALAIEGI